MDYYFDALSKAVGSIIGLDPEIYLVAWTSLKVSSLAAVMAAAIGVPIGAIIALRNFRGKTGVLLISNTLMALPTVVVGLFFYALLSRRGILGGAGLLYTVWGIVIGELFLILPIVVNLSISAVQGVDERLLLTCKSLGASFPQLAAMVIKEARFAVVAAVVTAFGRAIGEVGVAMMLGGNIKGFTRTMTTAIALETSKGEFELGLSLGIILLTAALLVNIALHWLQRRKG